MSDLEHTRYEEWLDLDQDGGLPEEDETRLAAHLAECPECQRQREGLARLHHLMRSHRVDVRAELCQSVLQELPRAPWETPQEQPWGRVAAIASAVVILASALVFWGEGALPATVSAVGDFLTTSILAGAGLLAASWHGVGATVDSWLRLSIPNLLASGAMVVGLNLLLFRLLRRRGRLASVAGRRRGSRDDPS